MRVFFSKFMGNELQHGTNKSPGSRDLFVPCSESFRVNQEKDTYSLGKPLRTEIKQKNRNFNLMEVHCVNAKSTTGFISVILIVFSCDH